MSWFRRVFLSSVAKKFWMGVTGLLLCLFIAFHLAANLLFFLGPTTYNGFSSLLEKIPILEILEIKLFLLFFVHIILGGALWLENRRARGGRYVKYGTKRGGAETTISKTMIYSGLLVFVYLIVHVGRFVFSDVPMAHGHADFYTLNTQFFSNPLYSLWYVVGVAVLAFHVSHGFQSALRSIGVNHDVYTPVIAWVSRAAALVVGVGFASVPVYVLFFFQGAQG